MRRLDSPASELPLLCPHSASPASCFRGQRGSTVRAATRQPPPLANGLVPPHCRWIPAHPRGSSLLLCSPWPLATTCSTPLSPQSDNVHRAPEVSFAIHFLHTLPFLLFALEGANCWEISHRRVDAGGESRKLGQSFPDFKPASSGLSCLANFQGAPKA